MLLMRCINYLVSIPAVRRRLREAEEDSFEKRLASSRGPANDEPNEILKNRRPVGYPGARKPGVATYV